MKLPPYFEKIRDEFAESIIWRDMEAGWAYAEGAKEGFDAAYAALLPEIEALRSEVLVVVRYLDGREMSDTNVSARNTLARMLHKLDARFGGAGVE
jgi:hypothetical protein